MLSIVCAVLILIGHAPDVTCQTGANVKALKQKLFVTDAYDYKVRPTDNQSEPIEIFVDIYLLAINEINEAQETIKTTAFLGLTWTDEFLQWDSSNYGGIERAFWPQGDVWKPDIALRNSNKDYKELGVPSLNVLNGNDGKMQWLPFHVFESTCSIDITNFPFDYQTCYLKFQAWSYSNEEIKIEGGLKGIGLTNYEPNSAWDIIDSSWKVDENSTESTISFKLIIRRKPLFFMLSVLLPILTLAILNLCVFLLPTTSGEKASYAITVFLAFAVFLTIVSSSLPQNSESVSLIAAFLIIQTICSTLITILALALLRMSSFDETVAIPRIFVFFMRCLKRKSCFKGPSVASSREGEICDTDSRMPDESSTADVNYSWKEVVSILDAVLFVLFACTLVASMLGCFLKAALNPKPN